MLQTAIVYTLLAFGMFYFTKMSSRFVGVISNIFYWIPILLFTIVFGIRYGVGVDYFNYVEIYEFWNTGSYSEERFELFPSLIFSFCDKFLLSPVFIFVVFSFLDIYFIYLAFKERKIVLAYSILMFIFLGVGIWSFMNTIRQGVAICIFLYSLLFICNKKFIYYCIFTLCAFFFHRSALILLPLYFLFYSGQVYCKNRIFQFVLLSFSACFSMLGVGQYLSNFFDGIILFLGYDNYIGTDLMDRFSAGWSFYTFVLFFVYILFVYFYPSVRKFYEKDRLFEIIYDLFFVGTCLNFIFMGNMMFGRILSYFTNLSFIIFGYYINYFVKNYKYSYLNLFSYLYIIVYILVFYSYVVVYKSYSNCIQYATCYQTHLFEKQERMNNDYLLNF